MSVSAFLTEFSLWEFALEEEIPCRLLLSDKHVHRPKFVRMEHSVSTLGANVHLIERRELGSVLGRNRF